MKCRLLYVTSSIFMYKSISFYFLLITEHDRCNRWLTWLNFTFVQLHCWFLVVRLKWFHSHSELCEWNMLFAFNSILEFSVVRLHWMLHWAQLCIRRRSCKREGSRKHYAWYCVYALTVLVQWGLTGRLRLGQSASQPKDRMLLCRSCV